MSEPLSFIAKVTSCDNCPHSKIYDHESWCAYYDCPRCEFETFEENCHAITPSCPAWQEQQKDKTE